MLYAVLSGFALSLAVPVLVRLLRGGAGLACALLPGFLLLFFLQFLPETVAGQPWRFAIEWNPYAGIGADLLIDAVSLFFALMVCAVTALAGVRWRDEARLGGIEGSESPLRLAAVFALMSGSLAAVLADSWAVLIAGHLAVSAGGFVLLASEPRRRGAVLAKSSAALWFSADFGLILALILMASATGEMGFTSLLASGGKGLEGVWSELCAVLIVFAAAAKTGLFPWVRGRLRLGGLTPSAQLGLVFGALVPVSGALLMRFIPVFGGSFGWSTALFGVAVFGIVVTVPRLWVERSLSRLVLSASCLLGAMAFGLIGLGTPGALSGAGLIYLLHATTLAGLALCVGVLSERFASPSICALKGTWMTVPFLIGVWALGAASLGALFPAIALIVLERALAGARPALSLCWRSC